VIDRDLATVVAAEVERKGGLPCGLCGGRHISTVEEWRSDGNSCTCLCCQHVLAESLAADFPDLVSRHHGRPFLSQTAVDEAVRRMEAELAAPDSD